MRIVCRWKLLYGVVAYTILLDDATVFCGNLNVTWLLPCQRNCKAVTGFSPQSADTAGCKAAVEGGRRSKEGRRRCMASDKEICGRIFAF